MNKFKAYIELTFNKVHWKCYLLQMQHPTFNKLNKAQQKEIRDNYNKYRYIWKK